MKPQASLHTIRTNAPNPSDERAAANGSSSLTPPEGAHSLRDSVSPAQPSRAPNTMSGPSNHFGSNDPDKLRMPQDAGRSGETGAGSTKSGSKSPVDVDAILARIVVEHGLATMDDVQTCLRLRNDASRAGDPGQSSLAQLLVDNDLVTKRQLERLRSAVEAERSGQHIPGYTVLGKLGAGAMATVFKARQVSLDRLVAIKILPRKFTSDPQFIERFYAEGRAAAQLNHPHIVQAYDVGKAGEFHYFVMEYVEGSTVYDQIIARKRYNEAEAIEIILQVALALEHAHDKGLIHRDVKPKNIMMSKAGVVKLADMGLARAISDREAAEAEAGKAFGTPYYISPEQVRGERDIGPPADIYSLGCTLYHMVTGRVPFEGKDPSEVMKKHLKAAPVPPDQINQKLSAGLCEAIEMMMAKRREDRYQSCRDLITDLKLIQKGEKPAIAHKPITGAAPEAISQLLVEEAQRPAEIAIDKTRAPSPFSHLVVQVMLVLLILSAAANFVLMFR